MRHIAEAVLSSPQLLYCYEASCHGVISNEQHCRFKPEAWSIGSKSSSRHMASITSRAWIDVQNTLILAHSSLVAVTEHNNVGPMLPYERCSCGVNLGRPPHNVQQQDGPAKHFYQPSLRIVVRGVPNIYIAPAVQICLYTHEEHRIVCQGNVRQGPVVGMTALPCSTTHSHVRLSTADIVLYNVDA